MAPVMFKLPNFGKDSAAATVIVSGRDKSPSISRRASKAPVHLKPGVDDRKLSMSPALVRRSENVSSKIKVIIMTTITVSIALIAGILAVRFARNPKSQTNENLWQPANGTTWQIDLSKPLTDTSVDANVYDIDLFSNTKETIASLHALNRKVICYVSVGAYNISNPDQAQFQTSDLGNSLSTTSTERWVDTRSESVRSIMLARLDLAVKKGCDGIDPDHTDGYSYATGFDLSRSTALSYLQFLAHAGSERNLSMGLRNTGHLVEETVGITEWSINEGCESAWNCALYWPFVSAKKPVFHVVLVGEGEDVTGNGKEDFLCAGANTDGFTTILKRKELGNWLDTC